MKQSAPVNKLAWSLSLLVAIILVLLPFHAFITVWLYSLVGHYTLLRLWKEFLLVPITLGSVYILARDRGLLRRFLSSWLVRLTLLYLALLIICAAVAYGSHNVSTKAVWYGLLVDSRFLVLFLAVVALAKPSDLLSLRWRKILLVPAIFVAAFAILQYLVLPYDFLRHFGYSDSTISPYETINHNLQHIRVASTLRGANPLGAYLVLPITALCVVYIKEKDQKLDILVFLAGLLMALAFSFSRSAWIGAALTLAIAAWLGLKSDSARRIVGWAAAGTVVLVAILTFS